MRILYLTPNLSNWYVTCYKGMIDALKKYAEVSLYGVNWPEYDELKGSMDINQVIRRFYGSSGPDVIFMWDPQGSGWAGNFQGMENVDCLKVVWCVDVHNDVVRFDYFKQIGIRLILMAVGVDSNIGLQYKSLGIPVEQYHLSVDPNYYKPLGIPKKYDVTMLGSMSSSYYPVRIKFNEILLQHPEIKYYNPLMGSKYFDDYVKAINETKIFLTCSSSYHYPVVKYFEVMSCGTPLMADLPIDMEEMHLVPGTNFIDASPETLLGKINYYLANEGEAKKISESGRETVLKYHAHDVRAKELIETLQKHL